MYGLAKPARLPIELMIAMPAAAVAPDMNAVGSDQNSGAQVSTPAAASERNAIDTTVLSANEAATVKPIAPNSAGTIRCQRRSRRLSALCPIRFITTIAHRNGIALSRPILNAPVTPVDLTSVGIQNVRPYCPVTNAK